MCRNALFRQRQLHHTPSALIEYLRNFARETQY